MSRIWILLARTYKEAIISHPSEASAGRFHTMKHLLKSTVRDL